MKKKRKSRVVILLYIIPHKDDELDQIFSDNNEGTFSMEQKAAREALHRDGKVYGLGDSKYLEINWEYPDGSG